MIAPLCAAIFLAGFSHALKSSVVDRGGAPDSPFPGCSGSDLTYCPDIRNCTVNTLDVNIDHFGWAPPLGNTKQETFKLRYFYNDQFWSQAEDGTRGPIFFYFGNEDNVELYVNHTGLMWESAVQFKALLVFAEHRYYGESLPYRPDTKGCMNFLTTEQAMADFAYLIDYIRTSKNAQTSPVIGFGGSYGGMIAAWMRVHYPNAVDGVIAASAPIWSFTGLNPAYDTNAFYKIVTRDASTAGGVVDECKNNIKDGWYRIMNASTTPEGRALLQSSFRTCSKLRPPSSPTDPVWQNDAYAIVQWAESVWATYAMGNYPYPSTYLTHGEYSLPAYPVQKACLEIVVADTDELLFTALADAAGILYNITGDVDCFNITGQNTSFSDSNAKFDSLVRRNKMRSGSQDVRDDGPESCEGSWGYQYCTEMVQPFTMGTSDDMFYCNGTEDCSKWDINPIISSCQEQWGVTPRPEWASVILGGNRISAASNIVFSNGNYDPWSGGGVTANISKSVVSYMIAGGAHHLDLMFSDPQDIDSVVEVRAIEKAWIDTWIKQSNARYDKNTGTN